MRRKHAYRNGSKFSYQRSNGCSWLGYFEYREYDGTIHEHWTWSRWANQDRKAQRWVYNQLMNMQAGLTA